MFYHGKLIKSLIEYQQSKYKHRKMNKTLIWMALREESPTRNGS